MSRHPFRWWCAAALLAAAHHAFPRIETVFIVPTSHWDLGFVQPPEQVREMAARHLDQVLQEAERDPGFRWTIESVWQIEEWLRRSRGLGEIIPKDEGKVERLMRLIRSGRIDVSAVWGSTHSEFMGEEELNRLVYGFSALRRSFRIDSELAVMDDVPGQPFSLASVLASSGVRYLLVGANLFLAGGTSLAPGNVPFYWEGPDGGRVLTWVSQGPRGGYPEALADFFLDPYSNDPYMLVPPHRYFRKGQLDKPALGLMEEGMAALRKRYQDAGYPYDAVLVMHAHDFSPPTNVANLQRAVRQWNASGRAPKLLIATPTEFFRYIERKYGPKIPVFRGEWSGLWSDAKAMSPVLSAMARESHARVPAAETLWSALAMTSRAPFPAGNFSGLYHRLFLYDEHSGAGNTGWPNLNTRELIEEQNRQYVKYLQEARDEVRGLIRAGLAQLGDPAGRPSQAQVLVVYNPLSWERTGVLEVAPPGDCRRITAIRDARTGQTLNFDVDEHGRAVFLARDIPSAGYAGFQVEGDEHTPAPTFRPAEEAHSAENRFFQVRLAPDGTIASIVEKFSGRELVNRQAAAGFNRLLRVRSWRPADVPLPAAVRITALRGRLFTQLTIHREGSCFPATRIRLYDDLARIELSNVIDRRELPFAPATTGLDSYYFPMPFALEPDSLQVHVESQRGFHTLPAGYLPGARRDSATPQHYIAMADRFGSVTVAHRQAFRFGFAGFVDSVAPDPNIEKPLPAMYTGKWPLAEATLYAKAFHHTDQAQMRFAGVTNFETVEPGLDPLRQFDFAITASAGAFDPVAAARLAWEWNVPLETAWVLALASPSQSWFAVDVPNVRITTVKPAEAPAAPPEVSSSPEPPPVEKRFVIRLQEIAGKPALGVRVSLPGEVKTAEIVNLTEEKVLRTVSQVRPLVLDLKPFECLSVRVDLKP